MVTTMLHRARTHPFGMVLALSMSVFNENSYMKGKTMFTKKLLLGILFLPMALYGDFERLTVPVNDALVPQEFDANDTIEFAVVGKTYNSCYQLKDLDVKVDSRRKTVYLTQNALLHDGQCLQSTRPFEDIVKLSEHLAPGVYTIVDTNSDQKIGQIPVGEADGPQFGPDSYAYAPVEKVRIASDLVSGQTVAILSGTYANRCSRIQDVWVDRDEKVTTIRPIVIRVTDPNCRSGEEVPFQFSVPIAEQPFHAPHLVHVRAQDGRSANAIELEKGIETGVLDGR